MMYSEVNGTSLRWDLSGEGKTTTTVGLSQALGAHLGGPSIDDRKSDYVMKNSDRRLHATSLAHHAAVQTFQVLGRVGSSAKAGQTD